MEVAEACLADAYQASGTKCDETRSKFIVEAVARAPPAFMRLGSRRSHDQTPQRRNSLETGTRLAPAFPKDKKVSRLTG